MSNSDSLMAEKDLRSIKLEFLLRPTQEFTDNCGTPTSPGDPKLLNCHEEEEKEDGGCQEDRVKEQSPNEETEHNKENIMYEEIPIPNMPPLKLGELRDEDEDGFRTPTSLDKRIPLFPQCPLAPKKPAAKLVVSSNITKKTTKMKRKLSLKNHHNYQFVDVSSQEIDSLFGPELLANLGPMVKKPRSSTISSSS